MKDFFEPLTHVRMTAHEKEAMLSAVYARPQKSFLSSPFFPHRLFIYSGKGALAFGLMLLVGVGIVSYAEKALPGDALYGVKTGVNERVLSALAFSDETEARVETLLAHRRLEEIEQVLIENGQEDAAQAIEDGGALPDSAELALSAKEDAETNTVIALLAQKASRHSHNAKAHIEAVLDKGDTNAAYLLSAELETAISVHTDALASLASDDADNDTLSQAVSDLADANQDVEALGGSITTTIAETENSVSKNEAEEQLENAKLAFSALTEEYPSESVVLPETPETLPALSAEEGTTGEETTLPSLDTVEEAVKDVTTSLVDTTTLPSPDATPLVTPAEDTTILPLSDTPVAEPAPTAISSLNDGVDKIESIRLLLASCEHLFNEERFQESFIECGNVTKAIAALELAQELKVSSNGVIDVTTSVSDSIDTSALEDVSADGQVSESSSSPTTDDGTDTDHSSVDTPSGATASASSDGAARISF